MRYEILVTVPYDERKLETYVVVAESEASAVKKFFEENFIIERADAEADGYIVQDIIPLEY